MDSDPELAGKIEIKKVRIKNKILQVKDKYLILMVKNG